MSEAGWVDVTAGQPRRDERPFRRGRVIAFVAAAAVAVVLAVALVGVQVARQFAEDEAVDEAARTSSLVGSAVIEPLVSDSLITGDSAAVSAIDEVVRDRVLGSSIVRVKIWDHDGRIVYSDETRLIGQVFDLEDEELRALAGEAIDAEVSDLDAPENRFERDRGELLEAYSGIETPTGDQLLFETYLRYDDVVKRSGQLWQGFAAIALASILILIALLVPLLWRLLRVVERGRENRAALLQKSLDASADERRRIAGDLHDGIVQELTGTSYAISAAAAEAGRSGDAASAKSLNALAGTVRGSIGGLRTLLVDVYPPTLRSEGLSAALADLAEPLRARGIDVEFDVPVPTRLDEATERLVFRVVQECLRNTAKHANAAHVAVRLQLIERHVRLSVDDDGVGFDATAVIRDPVEGHLGLQVLADLVADAGGSLEVASAATGTRWRMQVQTP